MFCRSGSPAQRRYERDVLIIMSLYVVLTFADAFLVKHGHLHGWALYVCSVLPALPIIVVIVRMGRYLQEETDEYQRLVTMRSILVGTAALLGSLVVNDFIRGFAGAEGLPPFATFVIFGVAMGSTKAVQRLRDRAAPEEGSR